MVLAEKMGASVEDQAKAKAKAKADEAEEKAAEVKAKQAEAGAKEDEVKDISVYKTGRKLYICLTPTQVLEG